MFEFRKLVMFITSPGSILLSIIHFVSDLSQGIKLAMCSCLLNYYAEDDFT